MSGFFQDLSLWYPIGTLENPEMTIPAPSAHAPDIFLLLQTPSLTVFLAHSFKLQVPYVFILEPPSGDRKDKQNLR